MSESPALTALQRPRRPAPPGVPNRVWHRMLTLSMNVRNAQACGVYVRNVQTCRERHLRLRVRDRRTCCMRNRVREWLNVEGEASGGENLTVV